MKTNVCIIGHFGADKPFRDGQTVKTRTLEQALRNCASDKLTLYKVDTYGCRNNILKFFRQLTVGIFSCNRIILCVSRGGRRVFFPLMYLLSRLFGKRVYHCAIGGRLADEVRANAKWKRYVKEFRYNWVESIALADELKSLDVINAEYMPNFKNLPCITEADLPETVNQPMRFCTFSRVMEEKGITDAVHAVIAVNKNASLPRAFLDVYGPVQNEYEEKFTYLLGLAPEQVRYCGEIDPDKSVEVLNKYDVLLFPTKRRREGVPGTIIDALCAGLPVIASRWRYCDEMLKHGMTGYCYEIGSPEDLKKWIGYAVSNPQDTLAMRKNCLAAAEKYRSGSVVPMMVQQLLEE